MASKPDRSQLCPFCAESISGDALKCRHCGEFVGHARLSYSSGKKRTFLKRLFSRTKNEEGRILMIPIEMIESNPYQPREFLDKPSLAGLKRSVKEYGIIIPIIVRPEGARYQLVAGQRRLAAARELGLKFVPSIVRNLNVREMMEVGYLENLHRQDLNRVDKIQMFERICVEYPEIGRDKLAGMLGLSLEVLNRDKDILKMPVILQEALRRGLVALDHARQIQHLDKEKMLKAIEQIYQYRLTPDEAKDVVHMLTNQKSRYISSARSRHYHLYTCPYVTLLDQTDQQNFPTRKQAIKNGKIACMMCQ